MFENTGWLLITTVGPLVIGAAIIYAFLNRRRLTRREKVEQHVAVQDIYEDKPAKEERERERERV